MAKEIVKNVYDFIEGTPEVSEKAEQTLKNSALIARYAITGML